MTMMATKKRGVLHDQRDAVMRRIMAEGLATEIAAMLGIKYQAVQQWKRVPPEHVMRIAPLLKMRPEEIRPDVFRGRE